MKILADITGSLFKAGLDKLSEVAQKRKDKSLQAERILLKNENRDLKQREKFRERRIQIEKELAISDLDDLFDRGVRK